MFHLSIFCAKSTHFVNLTFIIYLWSDVCHLSARYLYIVFKTIIRSSCCNQLLSNNSLLKITTLVLASLLFTCIYDLFLYYHSINQMSIFFLSTPIYFILLFVISQTIMSVVFYCLFKVIYTNALVNIKTIYYSCLLYALRALPLFPTQNRSIQDDLYQSQEVLLSSTNHQLLTVILAAHKKKTRSFKVSSKLDIVFLFNRANCSLSICFTVFSAMLVFSKKCIRCKNCSDHIFVKGIQHCRIHSRLNRKRHECFIH